MRKFVRDESNIEDISRILEAEKKATEAQVRLAEDVQKPIIRIEAGEPLLGGCDTCPMVYFRPKTLI
jgi:hypothetical protein